MRTSIFFISVASLLILVSSNHPAFTPDDQIPHQVSAQKGVHLCIIKLPYDLNMNTLALGITQNLLKNRPNQTYKDLGKY